MLPKLREAIEKSIVKALVQECIRNHSLFVSVDTQDGYLVNDSQDTNEILKAVFDLDHCYISFSRDNDPEGEILFWVMVVCGNDGYDVLSDYSIPKDEADKALVESIMEKSTSFSERITNGEFLIQEKPDYTELATRVLAAQKVHEESYVSDKSDAEFATYGHYTKDHLVSAIECARDKMEAQLIWYLNSHCWNDIQCWATLRLGENYKTDDKGHYYSPDGVFHNPDGTRSVFDDVDKSGKGEGQTLPFRTDM